jgi:hypothetical protein
MTVVVAFNCPDGVVIGADSMITPSMGNMGVGHHHGQKIAILPGPQLFAFAGDLGQCARFRIIAETNHAVTARYRTRSIFRCSFLRLPYNNLMRLGSAIRSTRTLCSLTVMEARTIAAYSKGCYSHDCLMNTTITPRSDPENYLQTRS